MKAHVCTSARSSSMSGQSNSSRSLISSAISPPTSVPVPAATCIVGSVSLRMCFHVTVAAKRPTASPPERVDLRGKREEVAACDMTRIPDGRHAVSPIADTR